ncbi:hypothetical protein NQ317_006498 [Molorchus minor]|uniref:CRAL-TRIO domain-containing protein n=1 Tax=Molorchus minor TaxID=1323400 RepID=A0ABQ9J764_9CUCU|nr:hypothetical protein NQ317_006498 [Molorchus minor]
MKAMKYNKQRYLTLLMTSLILECAPTRLKGIHIINQPYIFKMLYQIFKPFLGERIKKCLFFHGSDRKALTEKISAESLPEHIGGTAGIPEYPGSLLSDMLFYYEEDFITYSTYGYTTEKVKSNHD